MTNKITKTYSELPSWAKGFVAVAGTIFVGYIIYNAYRKVAAGKGLQDALTVAKDAKAEVSILQSKGIKPSYAQTQYEAFSLKLVEAMNGCGTTWDSVKSVFESMKNKADVLRLVEVFGVRYYRPCPATDPVSYTRYMFDEKTFGGNLQTWLEYDLSGSEIKDINDILSSKSIDFKF
jgi:hypothetical protein